MKLLLVVASFVACISTGQGTGQPPADTRSQGPALRIDAVFVDRAGVPVPDIRPDEVEVWIAGLRIPIESLSAPLDPDDERADRSVVIVMDDVTTDPTQMPRAREVARRFITRAAPGDRMAILTLSDGIKRTAERAGLLSHLERINTRATGLTRIEDLGALVIGTMDRLAQEFAEDRVRHRTIVAIGNAWVFDRPIPPPTATRDLRREWTSAVRSMAAANVTLYVIDPGGVGGAPVYSGDGGFARDSGGHAFVNTNDLDRVVGQVMNEIATYYTIAAPDPPRFRNADLRDVEVRVRRDGVTVRARRLIVGKS